MSTVIETLKEEHRNALRLLEALEHQIGVFEADGTPDYDIIRGAAAYFLDFPDLCHHPKEDAIFSRLARAHPGAAARVGDLPGEHRRVDARALRLNEVVEALLGESDISRSEVVAAARAFIEAERAHMSREEAVFLPLALEVMTEEDWDAVDGALSRRPDPLFGARAQDRFHILLTHLLQWEEEYADA